MHKILFNKITKCFLSHLLFWCFSVMAFASSSPQKNNIDPATVQWAQRSDVKSAVNQLQEAQLALDTYVQRIYNAYAPYTIGEGKVMRDRMKDLDRLITCAGHIEGIAVQFKGSTEATIPYTKSMMTLKRVIRFYYFDQELKTVLGWESNVIRQTLFALESLEDSKRHPDFIKVTKFDRNEAIRIIKHVDSAVNAAVATIPGGAYMLKFK